MPLDSDYEAFRKITDRVKYEHILIELYHIRLAVEKFISRGSAKENKLTKQITNHSK